MKKTMKTVKSGAKIAAGLVTAVVGARYMTKGVFEIKDEMAEQDLEVKVEEVLETAEEATETI